MEQPTFKRCDQCPVSCGLPCIAEQSKAKSLCDKLDPAHSTYNPNYAKAIIDQSCHPEKYQKDSTNTNIPNVTHNGIKSPFRAEDVAKKNAEFPSMWEQAKNFAGSMIEHVKGGLLETPDEVYKERLSICALCEFFINKRCEKCGCYMEYKARLASAECPIQKWNKWEPAAVVVETPKAGGCGCGSKSPTG